MAGSNLVQIKKLQSAINSLGGKIGIDTNSFWSEEQKRYIPLYRIKQAIWDEDTGKFKYVELFKSTAQIQIVLFLRDIWYEMNGNDPPKDNEYWNNIKSQSTS